LWPALALPESGAPPNLLSLIQRFWDPHPEQRPLFEDISEELYITQKHLDANACIPSYPAVSNNENGNTEVRHYQEPLNWFDQGEQFVKSANKSDPVEKLWSVCFDHSEEYHPTLSWGSFATCGRRETMEDTHFMLPHMSEEKDVYAFGIFDGHRGSVAKNLFSYFTSFYISPYYISVVTGSAAAEFSVGAVPGFLKQLGQETRFVLNV
jgi:hypothetical protein